MNVPAVHLGRKRRRRRRAGAVSERARARPRPTPTGHRGARAHVGGRRTTRRDTVPDGAGRRTWALALPVVIGAAAAPTSWDPGGVVWVGGIAVLLFSVVVALLRRRGLEPRDPARLHPDPPDRELTVRDGDGAVRQVELFRFGRRPGPGRYRCDVCSWVVQLSDDVDELTTVTSSSNDVAEVRAADAKLPACLGCGGLGVQPIFVRMTGQDTDPTAGSEPAT